MHFSVLSFPLSLSVAALTALSSSAIAAKIPIRPVVFYHGMGDSAHSDGMLELFASIQEIAPEIFIHSIALATSEAEDQRAGFFGNIDVVCHQLKAVKELEGGFNAVGFSQGGQFLRAYIQRCNDPPVHNLVTLGSQHGGVSDIPGCMLEDPSCRLMRSIARSGVYSRYVRDHIVQAQYYKDPHNLQTYLQRNIFLPDINNELTPKNATYKKNLSSINKLVMFLFMDDITVKPKETAWFGFQDETGDIVDLEDQDQYKKDWLGLRTMDQAGKLVFDIMEGEHMQFSLEDFNERITLPYLLEIEDGDDNDGDDGRKGKKKHHRKHGEDKNHQGKHHKKCHKKHHGKHRQDMVDQSEIVVDWQIDLQQQVL
ncbi:hypothetical protein BGZ54_006894 [Gamsiella multidivaricata]|nr:hypothetical protein BGZ54_006894 [Gamsiella multidivaricata]